MRRQCIPIIYTRGTYYEVGYDVGRTFASLIQSFVNCSVSLNKTYIPAYETRAGRKAYEDTLKTLNENYPQYVKELEGTADGAKVPFYKLFLLHMDDITPNVAEREGTIVPVGCTTICVNQKDEAILGHTEDAHAEVLNHFYIVAAHIISDSPQGRWQVTEERFTSLCYAGHLPGYTMNYNHHGLIFSVNTIMAKKLQAGKTPRHFITRALLTAENFNQAQNILRDSQYGAGDGCSINMTFINEDGERMFHNVEMGPADENNESQLDFIAASLGQNVFHCNMYLRLPVEQETGLIILSSEARMTALNCYNPPMSKEDVIKMLGDETVFRDGHTIDEIIKTIAVGIFDCVAKTWSLYSDNPLQNEALVVLPLVLKNQKV